MEHKVEHNVEHNVKHSNEHLTYRKFGGGVRTSMGVLDFFSKLMYACFHIPGYSVHLVITSSAEMGIERQEALVPHGNSIGAH